MTALILAAMISAAPAGLVDAESCIRTAGRADPSASPAEIPMLRPAITIVREEERTLPLGIHQIPAWLRSFLPTPGLPGWADMDFSFSGRSFLIGWSFDLDM